METDRDRIEFRLSDPARHFAFCTTNCLHVYAGLVQNGARADSGGSGAYSGRCDNCGSASDVPTHDGYVPKTPRLDFWTETYLVPTNVASRVIPDLYAQ